MNFKRGDLILVAFPFLETDERKNRPALIVGEDGDFVIVIFVTTKVYERNATVIEIQPSKQNNLKLTSVAIPAKLASIQRSQAKGKIGVIEQEILVEIENSLKGILGFRS